MGHGLGLGSGSTSGVGLLEAERDCACERRTPLRCWRCSLHLSRKWPGCFHSHLPLLDKHMEPPPHCNDGVLGGRQTQPCLPGPHSPGSNSSGTGDPPREGHQPSQGRLPGGGSKRDEPAHQAPGGIPSSCPSSAPPSPGPSPDLRVNSPALGSRPRCPTKTKQNRTGQVPAVPRLPCRGHTRV